MFGSIVDDNNKYGNDIYQKRDSKLKKPSTQLPKIGVVTPANAMRAIHLSTPGRDSIPNSISTSHKNINSYKKGYKHSYKQRYKPSIPQETNFAANINITVQQSDPEGENNNTDGNTVRALKVKKKVTWFPTIKREGKEDAIVVERGFQHKATKEYVDEQYNTQETPKYCHDNESRTLSITQSRSITQVLVAEIVGTPDYNDIV
eukprot:UN08470